MKYGPLIFLAAFFALSASWFGFVLVPQIQIGGGQQETNTVNTSEMYPLGRPGLALQGLEVYRANGCAACHSQQVGQTGVACDVILTDVGTNPTAVARAVVEARILTNATAPGLAGGLPRRILEGVPPETASKAASVIAAAGGKAEPRIIPMGPDIDRHWGLRRSVAADFLFDSTVMPGSLRIGPDLANVGMRWPVTWQLLHLYEPRSQVKDSPMPPYRYLFEKRKIGERPSPDALQLPEGFAPKGYEIVPRPEAKALVAYLQSLRADVSLAEAPLTPPGSAASATNATMTADELQKINPAASATNAPTK